ncbi:transcriptional regulator [Alcaligenes sp. WGS1538]|uniref:transcriptional regulator n=1 Tax=Alcaligenes sp. WGS1538 TaxID=3366811 RepID=UPI00372D2F80
MGKKETEEAIEDSRAGRVTRAGSVAELLVELNADDVLAEATSAGAYPLPPEEREWADTPAVGRELLVEDLQSAEAIHAYLAHAEATGDVAYVEHAREIAAQAKIRYGIE